MANITSTAASGTQKSDWATGNDVTAALLNADADAFDAHTHDVAAATEAQGALADSAVQPGDTIAPTDGTVDSAKAAGGGLIAQMLHDGTKWTDDGTTAAVRPASVDFPTGFVWWYCQEGNEPAVSDGSGFLAGDLVVTYP